MKFFLLNGGIHFPAISSGMQQFFGGRGCFIQKLQLVYGFNRRLSHLFFGYVLGNLQSKYLYTFIYQTFKPF